MDYFCSDLLLLLVEEAIYILYDLVIQFMVSHAQLVLDELVDEREPLNSIFTERSYRKMSCFCYGYRQSQWANHGQVGY